MLHSELIPCQMTYILIQIQHLNIFIQTSSHRIYVW